MMKSEMYYLRKFYTYEELEATVIEYIDYYNTRRYQKRLNCMTPLEYRQYLLSSAAENGTNHGDTVSATTFFVFYTVYLTGVSSELKAIRLFVLKKICESIAWMSIHEMAS
ncbi:IS3 family transposase [Paenibacillus larvae]|uniref:IS3 family transposase n=1 Tax=Paenibacillus larvae TaxID=1464 RepID=UPI0037CA1334